VNSNLPDGCCPDDYDDVVTERRIERGLESLGRFNDYLCAEFQGSIANEALRDILLNQDNFHRDYVQWLQNQEY
jgi:hypothetical protein